MSTSATAIPAPRREQTRDALLAAALTAFATNGYDAVRVEEVAAAAGLSVGSVYVHFESKQGLYVATVERAFNMLDEAMAEAYDQGRSPASQVDAAGRVYHRLAVEHPEVFRLVVLPPTHLPDTDRIRTITDQLAQRQRALVGRLRDALERGAADGSLQVDDAEATAWFLTAAWSGVIATMLRPDAPSGLDLDEVLAAGEALVSRGLDARRQIVGDDYAIFLEGTP